MVQGWWGSMGFQVLGIWMFRGLCRSRDSREWLVGTITKMEKAYANYLWGVFSFKGLGLKLEGLLELGTRVYRVDVAEDS